MAQNHYDQSKYSAGIPIPPRGMERTAIVICWWGLLFAAIHVYWLAGGKLGLPIDGNIYMNLPLLVIDILAIPMCLLASFTGLSLIRSWGARFPRWIRLALAWFGFLVPFLHAVQGYGELIFIKAGWIANPYSEGIFNAVMIFEGIFLSGGILFGLLLWQYYRYCRI